ncbi:Hypothetical predicted protein [Cloeon dipterum]|uniref:Uncharacterized protein n=1 Tax=Cloeon dipterum TaxID=197152 RepID=A0A8S1E380_9INSE|nr:Hypothetical predicted protein [Cloeon dipterum]
MDEHNDESRLTHIAHKLWEDVRKPLVNFFPRVNQLQIEWCPEHLTLTNVPESDYIDNFMLAYERKLLGVTVKFSNSTELCMKNFQGLHLTLRKLVVGVIKPHLGETFWSLRNFESLTELEIEFAVTWDTIDAICVVPICDLFLAPNLEKVKLFGQLAVDAEHLQEVHERIVFSRNILRRVKDFEMRLIKQGSAFFVTTRPEDIVKKKEFCDSITEFYKEKGVTVSIEFVTLNL